jgi:hypothetical protein
MDAYCESLHEVYAGNFSFLRSVVFYSRLLAGADMKFPKLKLILNSKDSAFTDLQRYLQERSIDGSKYISFGKLFTKRSLEKPSQFPFYDRWRAVTLERGGKEGMDALIKQKEFSK